jgi:hypothetical protein
MLAVALWLWLFRFLLTPSSSTRRGWRLVPAALPCLRNRKLGIKLHAEAA